ncbi:Phytochrome-associated serine/threonine-protein phosphatase [Spatholobus suberectus]|nr:Phytochrome-associated serine/threonine-protein phosphatase [Spatholobus suberectus]
MDLDQWISKVKDGQHLLEDELQLLYKYVTKILIEESNVQPINSLVAVCVYGFYDECQRKYENANAW